MRRFRSVAPWFRSRRDDGEPLSYRGWKKFCQTVTPSAWSSNLFDKIERTEWDLLIILDACRYDVLAEVAQNAAVGRAVSPATATAPFLRRAYERGVFDGTTYISANPQSDAQAPGTDIEHVSLYEDAWDDSISTVDPASVYEAAERHVDGETPVVAHTLQPHYPHICTVGSEPAPVPGGLHPEHLENDDLHLQGILANGSVDLDRAWWSYRACTVFAWQQAFSAAEQMRANGYTVAITADHGETFGDWGFVEHPVGIPIPELTNVPWVVVSPTERKRPETDGTVNRRLEQLGYKQPSGGA